MGQDKSGRDDVTNTFGTDGEVPQWTPTAGQHSESTLAPATHASQQSVAGSGIEIERRPSPGQEHAGVAWSSPSSAGVAGVVAGVLMVIDGRAVVSEPVIEM
jgi:hypothetical protein